MNHVASYLSAGYWESTGRSARSFDIQPGGVITVNITNLAADGQQLARWALDAWSSVTGIVFREVTSRDAQIIFDDNAEGAWSRSAVNGNTIIQSEVNVSTEWVSTYGTRMDTYSYSTYLHEIGHALGLGHSGPYNGGYPIFFVDNVFLEDSWQMSVMSYINQLENPMIVADYAHPVTPMTADILAIQDLYGRPDTANAGNTIYGVNSNVDDYMVEFFSVWTGENNPFFNIDMTYETQPDFYDFDNDGDLDMTTLSPTGRLMYFYLNVGTPTDPSFVFLDFIVWGIPILDYEFNDLFLADGKADLFIVDTDAIHFIADVFGEHITSDGTPHGGWSSDAEFVDLDGDGDLDLFVMSHDGIAFSRNIGTSRLPDFSDDDVIVETDAFADMNDYKFADVDSDGDYDMVLVDNRGVFYFVENVGSARSLDFGDVTAHVNPLDAATYWDGPVHTIQDFAFADIDGDGDVDMFSFDAESKIYYFENVGEGAVFQFNPTTYNHQVTFTIYDTHGADDTLDVSTDANDQLINLGAGQISNVYGLIGNIIIGPDTVIENVVAGSGDDQIFGNSANNKLEGNDGDDLLWGGAGRDDLWGGDGTDILNGGFDDDVLWGSVGDDVLSGGPGDDVFVITPNNAGSLDLIMDFSRGEDKIYLEAFDGLESVAGLPQLRVDGNLVIDLDEIGGGKVALHDFSGNLDTSDFVIA